ncbi:LysR family transcriptional regulator [Chryseobacterium sp. Mn2064]|uniref:LysR family transcriptional regulator n=1 Tax=Chryseobacterium sp. Mn2064 TaxID=3395263 RepID=UPI003BEB2706
MVNLEWYRTFKTVYETGSLTAASKLLFISQPNVSQHIAALEAHIGKALFERRHKVIPTDYAEIIYRQIVDPIYKLEEVESVFKKMCLTKSKPTINIGIEKEYLYLFGSSQLSSLPAIFIVTVEDTVNLREKLANGSIDFLISSIDDKLPKFKSQILFEDYYNIVASEKVDSHTINKLIKNNDLEEIEKWLVQQNWISTSSEMPEARLFWQKNFRKIPVIIPYFIIPDQHGLLEIVSQSDSIAIMPNHLLQNAFLREKLQVIWSGNTKVKKVISMQYNPLKIPSNILSIMETLLEL